MKRGIIILSVIIILLSLFSSLIGTLSYNYTNTRLFETARGENIELITDGIYKNNPKVFVVGAIPFDMVRLFFGIPILLICFIAYIKGSLRGAIIYIGMLLNLTYQYLLWTFGFTLNILFLAYVLVFSLSIITVILIIGTLDFNLLKESIRDTFPVKIVAVLNFSIATLLLFKCLGEVIPTIFSNQLSGISIGQFTLYDQALDIGILVPLSIFSGWLILKRNIYGYILSASSSVLFLNLGISIVIAAIVQGVETGEIAYPGIFIFTMFCLIVIYVLTLILRNIKQRTGTGAHFI